MRRIAKMGEKPRTLKIVLKGDKKLADRLRLMHGARALYEFRNLTEFQNLIQNERRIDFADGSHVRLETRFGHEIATFYVPPQEQRLVEEKETRKHYFYRLPLNDSDGYILFPLGTFEGAEEVHETYSDPVFSDVALTDEETEYIDRKFVYQNRLYTQLTTFDYNMGSPVHSGSEYPWDNLEDAYFWDDAGHSTEVFGEEYYKNDTYVSKGVGETWSGEHGLTREGSFSAYLMDYHVLGGGTGLTYGAAYRNDLTQGYLAVLTEHDFYGFGYNLTNGTWWLGGSVKYILDGQVIQAQTAELLRPRNADYSDYPYSSAFNFQRLQAFLGVTNTLVETPLEWPSYVGVSSLDGGNHYFLFYNHNDLMRIGSTTTGTFAESTYPISGGLFQVPFGDTEYAVSESVGSRKPGITYYEEL